MKATLIIFFGIISLIYLVMGVYEFFMQRRLISGAQQVQATITDTGVVWRRDLTSEDSNGVTTYQYEPQVKFTYEFEGKQYEGNMLRPLYEPRAYVSSGYAAAELEAFPVGAKVQAFVSPRYPEKAYLKKEYSKAPIVYMAIGVGVPLFIFGLIKLLKL